MPHGLDGELIYGLPTSSTVFAETTRFVRSADKECQDWKYYVFDYWDMEAPYYERQRHLHQDLRDDLENTSYLAIVETAMAEHEDDVLALEKRYVEQGYEGVILRNPHGIYKYGRTSEKENNAYKLKRFADSEAVVIGIIPEYHNANELKRGATGKIERSTAADGLIAKESMGALVVYDKTLDVEFNIGTEFTADERKWWWDNRSNIGAAKPVVSYKYFPVGVKEKPRHPVYKGVRWEGDMS